MKKAVVIGAGFSGLTTTYFLTKLGWQVDVYEKNERAGGLLLTDETEFGLIESAANGLLNSIELEKMAQEIGLKLLRPLKVSRKRYIFRNKPKRWPLTFLESLSLIRHFLTTNRKPKKNESISRWGERVLGHAGEKYLLAPALQGIYAGDAEKLSSSLILSRFFKKAKKLRPTYRGTVSPEKGMGELIQGLEKYLSKNGVRFHFKADVPSFKPEDVKVISTDSNSAALLLKTDFPEAEKLLMSIERLPLVSITAFFPHEKGLLDGFGVLFPKDQGFFSLGVLFNGSIFSGRSNYRSETWIMGGAMQKDMTKLGDSEIIEKLMTDRTRLYKKDSSKPLSLRITRWPQALPHYTIELEKTLKALEEVQHKLREKKIYLAGNYLGRIGLSQLLEASKELAENIEADYLRSSS